MAFEGLVLLLKEVVGVDPSNMLRRLLVGGIIILVSGFVSFGAIFYSFISAFDTTTLLCPLPDESINLIAAYFTFPLIIIGLYTSLIAAVIYLVNPWERLK